MNFVFGVSVRHYCLYCFPILGARDCWILAGFAAVGAEAAYFCAGYGDFYAAVAGDLGFELLVEFAFEFADFSAADAGYVDVVARTVAFVEMAIAAEVQEIELVDQPVLFEQVDGAVDGDQVHARIDFLRAIQNLVDVQVLLGVVHHLENHAALAGQTNSPGSQSLLESAGGFRGVDSFAGRGPVLRRHGHAGSPEVRRPKSARNGWAAAARRHCT